MLRAIKGYDGFAMTDSKGDNDTFAKASQENAGEIPMDEAAPSLYYMPIRIYRVWEDKLQTY